MTCKSTLPLFSAIIAFSLSSTGCFVFSEKPWEYTIVAGFSNSTSVHVAYDSPEVRKLVADGDPPDELFKMPGFSVPVKSYCSIIERSTSKCGPTPEATAVYVMIKVTSGPSLGKQGWACEIFVHQIFP